MWGRGVVNREAGGRGEQKNEGGDFSEHNREVI